jgi:single-strand DNA-binding protein
MQLIGLARLGKDAELRTTGSGDPVANLSLAFNYGRKGEDGKKPTQWVEASLWGKLAEALEPYLLKGTAVSVTLDDPHIETFEGRNGTGHKLVSRVLSIELAGGGERREGQPPAPAPRAAPAPAPRPAARAPAPAADDDDSDVPF